MDAAKFASARDALLCPVREVAPVVCIAFELWTYVTGGAEGVELAARFASCFAHWLMEVL